VSISVEEKYLLYSCFSITIQAHRVDIQWNRDLELSFKDFRIKKYANGKVICGNSS
jgi:hypothetical protein